MPLNYLDRQKALDVINQWILDGSRVESWGTNYDCEFINLRGKDGVLEDFVIWFDEEGYRTAANNQVDDF